MNRSIPPDAFGGLRMLIVRKAVYDEIREACLAQGYPDVVLTNDNDMEILDMQAIGLMTIPEQP